MAITPLSQAVGYTPVEVAQEAIPVVPVQAGSSPAPSSGGGTTGFAPAAASPAPSEVLPIQASNLSPQSPAPASNNIGDALSGALEGLDKEEAKNPAIANAESPVQGKLDALAAVAPPTEIPLPEGSVELPTQPVAPGETPKPAEAYKSVLSPIVTVKDNTVNIQKPTTVQAVTPDGATYTSVLPSMMATAKQPARTMQGYIEYVNQNATRNLPLSPRLESSMGFLKDLGVTMEVFSGGQPSKGSGKPRVGSVRHDHGDAADVFFVKDGRRLDWGKPEDVPLFQEIVRRGKASGLTGFGAGPGYMQQGSMHIGFGSPGVWGAGGSGVNAPAWLKEAFED